MSTLNIMKARIASELRRSNIATQIGDAISSAIAALEDERFTFSESRALTFNTVPGREFYDVADSALIPRLEAIDYVKVYISEYPISLHKADPSAMETLSRNGTQTGEPYCYCYYGQKLRLGYIPASVWEVRIGGVVRVPAPATGSEPNNPWMTTAEQLVRCRAKFELYTHVLLNTDMADRFNPENEASPTALAAQQLRRRTNRIQGGQIIMEGSW